MNASLLETPLVARHRALGGKLVEFGGWSMPVHYAGGIVAEHHATRKQAGLFDISHMGRLDFFGPQAGAFLDFVLSKAATRLKPGQVRYALVLNDAGGVRDDVLVYRHALTQGVGIACDGTAAEPIPFSLVVNAGNREKILAWLTELHPRSGLGSGVRWVDRTCTHAMLALQGPAAIDLFERVTGLAARVLKYYSFACGTDAGAPILYSRTGYTGEDGVEAIVPAEVVGALWDRLLEAGASVGLVPAGLGCRDTLRLEAAMPLYGHELEENTTPSQVGLDFAVDLDRAEFVGQAAVAAARGNTTETRRVGLSSLGKRIPRQGFPVAADATSLGSPIGAVTSGTFSPTFNQPLAMAFVPPQFAAVGTKLCIDVRGQAEPAVVVPLPFYKRPGGKA